MAVALISLASGIIGAFLSPFLQDIIQARQEFRARKRLLWERDLKKLDELETLLGNLVYVSGVYTDELEEALELDVLGEDVLKKLRFLELGLPGYEESSERIGRIFALYIEANSSKTKKLHREPPPVTSETGSKEAQAFVELHELSRQVITDYRHVLSVGRKPVGGLNEASLESQWQEIRSRFPWNKA